MIKTIFEGMSERFTRQLPNGYPGISGEHHAILGKSCICYTDSITRWEKESGQSASFTYPFSLIVLSDDTPLAIIRLERPQTSACTALCLITRDGKHRLIDELSAQVSQSEFLRAATTVVQEHSVFLAQ